METQTDKCTSKEQIWIKDKFRQFGNKYQIKKIGDVDRFLYEKMTGCAPEKESNLLKDRFWRTNRHKPQSRKQCLELGAALELSEEDMKYMVQAYYDEADIIFEESDKENPLYQKRIELLKTLEQEYLCNIHPAEYRSMGVKLENTENYLRHCFFQDALQYTSEEKNNLIDSHSSSITYVSEFQKNRSLIGEIPRKTMIRHIFILCSPYLSVKRINEILKALGYLPLSVGHESKGGEMLDELVISLLEYYEKECRGKNPLQCKEWLRKECSKLDRLLKEQNERELRFLYFKSLRNG
jgi:hypothetical protein